MSAARPTRIDRAFAGLRARREKGFIGFITAGDPDLRATRDITLGLEDAGVDIVELGVPFSDPLADGPVNQRAAERALAAGATLPAILDMVADLRKKTQVPILCYAYMNTLLAPGFAAVMARSATAGVDGFLVLDLPVEEAAPYRAQVAAAGLNQVFLVTPTSPADRIRRIAAASSGFVYAVSRVGVTGAQKKTSSDAGALLARTRALTDKPIALGFGLSAPPQVRAAARLADAVVVGSALVAQLHQAGRRGRPAALRWVRQMVRAAKEAGHGG